jgi:ribosomal protein L29
MTDLTFDPAALRALLDAASPAPWQVDDINEGSGHGPAWWIVNDEYTNPTTENDPALGLYLECGVKEDAELIAALRNQGTDLLTALAAAREDLDRSQALLGRAQQELGIYRRAENGHPALAEIRQMDDLRMREIGELNRELTAAREELARLRVGLAHVTTELAGTRQMLDVLTADDVAAVPGDGEQAATTDDCTCDLNLRTQCAACQSAALPTSGQA